MDPKDTDSANTDSSSVTEPDEKAPRTYTKDEVEAKLRGQGKKLAEYEAKLKLIADADEKRKASEKEAKRKTAEEQGQYKELLTVAEQRAAELEAKLASHLERETTRLEAVTAENEKRRKGLPKALADLIPDGLDADAVARQIDRLERLKGDKSVAVHGGGGRSAEPVDPMDAAVKLMNDRIDKRGAA